MLAQQYTLATASAACGRRPKSSIIGCVRCCETRSPTQPAIAL